jgi:hypothetical protein
VRNLLLGLVLLLSLVSVSTATVEDAGAASCWGDITSFYRSGSGFMAFASFGCSGMSSTGTVCIRSACSSVSVPSGTTRSTNVYNTAGTCIVGGDPTYIIAKAYIAGYYVDSSTRRNC